MASPEKIYITSANPYDTWQRRMFRECTHNYIRYAKKEEDKEKNMDDNKIQNILYDAACHNRIGTLQINGRRFSVRVASCTRTTDEPYRIECDILNPVSYADYCRNDIDEMHHLIGEGKRQFITNLLNSKYGTNAQYGPQIKDVIFNDPATIVFWKDGTKTVVKAWGENYDPEKGLAMAIAKKTLGNKHDYYNTFKKWLKKAPTQECTE